MNPTVPTPIDCDDAILLVAAEAERPLGETDARALRSHLEGCASCREASADELDDESDWISIARIPVRALAGGRRPAVVEHDEQSDIATLTDARARTAPAASDEVDIPALPVIDPGVYSWGDTIGRGGMGRVVEARDRRLGRTVAIKELLAGGLEHRFHSEARITARLQHPAIVNIHEAGRWPSGEPFYAMKLVKGSSLSDAVRGCGSFADRVALVPNVIAIVEAIAYAHNEGVIHRDIKPSNIVIGPFGETVVIDWGLAKDVSDAGGDAEAGPFRGSGDGATQAGLGTPQYMPPEQARGEAPDERFDVYALGASLYHVLSGEPPYGYGKPVDILGRLEAAPPPPVLTVAPETPADLAAIVDKAMARDRAERYPSAAELADDLRRFQAGKLVSAAAYTPWQLARRWMARHRSLVAAAAMVVLLGAVGGAVGVAKVLDERGRAQAARDQARAERAAVLVEQGRRELADGRPMRALPYLEEAYADSDSERLRFLLGQARRTADAQVGFVMAEGQAVDAVALSPDGERLAVAHSGGTISVSDGAGHGVSCRGHTADVTDLAWTADGTHVLSASLDNTARVWRASDGAEVAVFAEHGNAVRRVRQIGDAIASIGDDGAMWRWTRQGEPISATRATAGAQILGFDPTGVRALSSHYDVVAGRQVVEALVVDGRTRGEGEHLPVAPPDKVALAPGRAAMVDEGRITVAALSPFEELVTIDDLPGELTAIGFSPDGKLLVGGDASGAITVWDAELGVRLGSVVGHRAAIASLSFDAGGERLASGSADGFARVWRVAALTDTTAVPADGQVRPDAVDVRGELLAIPGRDSAIALVTPGAAPRLLVGHSCRADTCRNQPRMHMVQFDAAATRLVSSGADETVRVWDVASGRELRRREGLVFDVALSPAGDVVASAHGEHVQLWRIDSGEDIARLDHDGFITEVRFSGDGSRVLTASRTGAAHLWRASDGAHLAAMVGHRGGLEHLLVTADQALTAGFDGDVRMWRLSDGRGVGRIAAHAAPVTVLRLAADGRSFVTGGEDGVVKLWSADGALQVSIPVGTRPIADIAIDPRGHAVAVADDAGHATLWDAATGAPLYSLPGRGRPITRLAFTDSGATLAVLARDGAATLWAVPREQRTSAALAAGSDHHTIWALVDGRLVPRHGVPRGRGRGVGSSRIESWYDFSGDVMIGERARRSVRPPAAVAAEYRDAWEAFDRGDWASAHASLASALRGWAGTRPPSLAREYALFAARARVDAEPALALVRAITEPGTAARLDWLEALSEAYAAAGSWANRYAHAVADAAVADALPVRRGLAHLLRVRLAIGDGDPEVAAAEAAAAAAVPGDAAIRDEAADTLNELARIYHRNFAHTFDDRFGRAALVAYEGYQAHTRRPDRAEMAAWAETLRKEMTLPRLTGTHDKAYLRRGLRRRLPQILECYQRVLQTEPDTGGELRILLYINNAGEVTDTAMTPLGGDRGLAAVSRCVDNAVRTWSFPRPRYAPTTVVDYKFLMQPTPDQ